MPLALSCHRLKCICRYSGYARTNYPARVLLRSCSCMSFCIFKLDRCCWGITPCFTPSFQHIFTINIIPFLTEKHKQITPFSRPFCNENDTKPHPETTQKTARKRTADRPPRDRTDRGGADCPLPTFWLACPLSKRNGSRGAVQRFSALQSEQERGCESSLADLSTSQPLSQFPKSAENTVCQAVILFGNAKKKLTVEIFSPKRKNTTARRFTNRKRNGGRTDNNICAFIVFIFKQMVIPLLKRQKMI